MADAADAGTERQRMEARKDTLRSMIRLASLGMLMIYLVRFVLSVSLAAYPNTSFSIPLSIGVAYCGLIGSQRLNRDTLACFYFCCQVSVCLYIINTLLQTRELVLVYQGSAGDRRDVLIGMYLAFAMETLLAVVQVAGARWGREIVREHLSVTLGNSPYAQDMGASFTLDFVQDVARAGYFEASARPAAASAEQKRLTIASIPVTKYYRSEHGQAHFGAPGGGNAGSARGGSEGAGESEPRGAVNPTDRVAAGEQGPDKMGADLASPGPPKPVGRGSAAAVEGKVEPPVGASSNATTTAESFVQIELGSARFVDDPDADLCVICQDDLVDGVDIKVLPCKHFYHAVCVDAWLERNMACPMCMGPVPLVELPAQDSQAAPALIAQRLAVSDHPYSAPHGAIVRVI